jgi:hypothetical protein
VREIVYSRTYPLVPSWPRRTGAARPAWLEDDEDVEFLASLFADVRR